jgi:hypothetical protein
MLKHDIGINAGIIWNLLNEKGALTERKIGELTGFKEVMITMALGWLAREDKIEFFEKQDAIFIELKKTNYPEMYF